jgi:hypothetical protein
MLSFFTCSHIQYRFVAFAVSCLLLECSCTTTGATFLMDGFKIHFGWECPDDDTTCVPESESDISADQGLINGLFGTGAAM